MTTDKVAGGSRTIALAFGKAGVHASVNGGKAHKLPFKGEMNARRLAAALESPASPGVTTTVLLIGTRADGTPGWDQIDPDEFTAAVPHNVVVLSEAQALALEPSDKKPAAWIILATANSDGSIRGSARWWVQNDSTSTVTRADVHYLNHNYGQIFTLAGENLANSPAIVASLVESLLMHHEVARVYVWSQDGLSGHWGHMAGTSPFWQALRLGEDFVNAGHDVVVVPRAYDMLEMASKHYGAPTVIETAAEPATCNAGGKGTSEKE